MSPDNLSYFRKAFRKASDAIGAPKNTVPLVPGGKSISQYADALDDPANPDGQLLVKMADALSASVAPNHGYHQVVQIYKWMAGGK